MPRSEKHVEEGQVGSRRQNTIELYDMIQMYRLMTLSRTFEEELRRQSAQGEKTSMIPYLGIGQEAVPIGVCFAIRDEDILSPHFRGVAARLARGLSPKELMATWFARNMGLPIHPIPELNLMWQASTSLGASISIAVGAALAAKLRHTGQVAVSVFGDGTSNRGSFHEALNFAAVFKLAIVFVCENNQYAMSMPVSRGVPIKNIADRASAYGFPGEVVDGNDVMAVYEAVRKSVQRARRGLGPTLIEAKTYRLSSHSEHDEDEYRPEGEREEWERREPLRRLRTRLAEMGVAASDMAKTDRWAADEVEEAVRHAKQSPPMSREEMLERQQSICQDVYLGTSGGESE